MAVVLMERSAARRSLRTVRRTADQLAADARSDAWPQSRAERLMDVEADLHAIAEDWVDLRGFTQAPTSTCPVCGRGWRRLDPTEAARCVCCASLRRIHGYEDVA